jgi:hypothetical protein
VTEDEIRQAEEKFAESLHLAQMGMHNILDNDVSCRFLLIRFDAQFVYLETLRLFFFPFRLFIFVNCAGRANCAVGFLCRRTTRVSQTMYGYFESANGNTSRQVIITFRL